MYPAQSVAQDVKLARSVAEDDQIRIDRLVSLDAPQQGAFRGDADMPILSEPQRLKSLLPLRIVVKDALPTTGVSNSI